MGKAEELTECRICLSWAQLHLNIQLCKFSKTMHCASIKTNSENFSPDQILDNSYLLANFFPHFFQIIHNNFSPPRIVQKDPQMQFGLVPLGKPSIKRKPHVTQIWQIVFHKVDFCLTNRSFIACPIWIMHNHVQSCWRVVHRVKFKYFCRVEKSKNQANLRGQEDESVSSMPFPAVLFNLWDEINL